MNFQELCQKYDIPLPLLNEYLHIRGLGSAAAHVYDEQDVEYLSLLSTLHDIGFSTAEIYQYMNEFLTSGTNGSSCLYLLDQKRKELLSAIHAQEKQLSIADYLRYELQRQTPLTKEEKP